VVVAALCGLVTASAGAKSRSFKPPHHKTFHGVTDTTVNRDFHIFARRVDAHPAVLEDFYHWDTPLTSGARSRWHHTHTRGVLSLSTAAGGEPERITPKQIAQGRGDHYILRLNATIHDSGQVVYIRLFPEMNGSWNPYSAFNADGSRRPGHSTKQFKRAWRRFTIIVRGGRRGDLNRRLAKQGMPRILRARSNHAHIYHDQNVPTRLPHPKVALMWTPQTSGSPDVHHNGPRAYWPGKHYVDWVGADIYSAYASAAFPRLNPFYRHWRKLPFVIGEYSPYDDDYSGAFVRRLFSWGRKHSRVRMLIYYREVTDNIYDINHYPGAKRSLRRILNRHRYLKFAPGVR
jgi:hypothetical protein